MSSRRPAYISISGGIAVGKTTLAGALGAHLPHAVTMLEVPEHNPYMAEFYEDMARWNFHSRVFMLSMAAAKYQVIRDLSPVPDLVVLDRCLQESICFAWNQAALGNFVNPDYETFIGLFDTVAKLVPGPDVVVHLTCSDEVAMERIVQRGRSFERRVEKGYLQALNQQYERWLGELPRKTRVLAFDTSDGLDARLVGEQIIDAIAQC